MEMGALEVRTSRPARRFWGVLVFVSYKISPHPGYMSRMLMVVKRCIYLWMVGREIV